MGTLELTQIEALELLAKEAKGKLEYRRIQSVLLREKFGKDVEDIAKMLQLHKRTVYKHCERYEKEGSKALSPSLKYRSWCFSTVRGCQPNTSPISLAVFPCLTRSKTLFRRTYSRLP